MVRTVFLMLGFAWFTNQGARYGNVTLAANHVLLQLVSLSAFFLDGFTAVLAATIWLAGEAVVAALTDLEAVRATALAQLPFAAAYVLLSFPAFQLDGVFIGATRTRAMRDAAILSFAAFLAAWWLLALEHGNRGLWIAFILYVLARAAALGVYFPGLRAAIPERRTRAA